MVDRFGHEFTAVITGLVTTLEPRTFFRIYLIDMLQREHTGTFSLFLPRVVNDETAKIFTMLVMGYSIQLN